MPHGVEEFCDLQQLYAQAVVFWPAAGILNNINVYERCPTMRRIIVTALLAFAVAPVAASVAAGGSDAAKNASVACTAQKAKIGALAFAQAYTTFGACVSP